MLGKMCETEGEIRQYYSKARKESNASCAQALGAYLGHLEERTVSLAMILLRCQMAGNRNLEAITYSKNFNGVSRTQTELYFPPSLHLTSMCKGTHAVTGNTSTGLVDMQRIFVLLCKNFEKIVE